MDSQKSPALQNISLGSTLIDEIRDSCACNRSERNREIQRAERVTSVLAVCGNQLTIQTGSISPFFFRLLLFEKSPVGHLVFSVDNVVLAFQENITNTMLRDYDVITRQSDAI